MFHGDNIRLCHFALIQTDTPYIPVIDIKNILPDYFADTFTDTAIGHLNMQQGGNGGGDIGHVNGAGGGSVFDTPSIPKHRDMGVIRIPGTMGSAGGGIGIEPGGLKQEEDFATAFGIIAVDGHFFESRRQYR